MKQLQADYRNQRARSSIDLAAPDSAEQAVAQMEEFGFAVMSQADNMTPEVALIAIADTLHLGEPHVPETAHLENTASPYKHVMGYQEIEGWHVDGLLEPVGGLRTTALYCVNAARTGGATALFNSLAAFAELRGSDESAAATLLAGDVLERRPLLHGGGYGSGVTGPAFAVHADGTLSTRFSDNHTCRWNKSAGAPGDLDRALDFLRKATEQDQYRIAVRLAPGETLLFRNDRLAHDRTPYEDDPESPRLLVRALYRRSPQCRPN